MTGSAQRERLNAGQVAAEASLLELAAAANVTLKRNGHQRHVGLCPFHSENSASFTVYTDGPKDHYHCYGCGAHGDAVTFVMDLQQLTLPEALDRIAGRSGGVTRDRPIRSADSQGLGRAGETPAVSRTLKTAQRLWHSAQPAAGTLAETYLRSRGIALETIGGMPLALRFHDAVDYWGPAEPEGDAVRLGTWPAMVAKISGPEARFLGAHVTYLLPDGSGKIELPDPDRPGRLLPARKVFGHAAGGTIRLTKAAPRLLLAEGIETALSGTILRSGQPAWAFIALSWLKETFLPASIRDVTILGDNDMKPPEPGKRDPKALLAEGAQALGGQASGRRVRIDWAPAGMDFNDVLTSSASSGPH